MTLGILGGLGPLASAKFLSTISSGETRWAKEQDRTPILLVSDPSYPDRTETLVSNDPARRRVLVEKTTRHLELLYAAGATRVVICCFTLHAILGDLDPALRAKVIELPRLALEEVLEEKRRALVLCTTGARKLGVFEKDPLFEEAERYIVFPDAEDQDRVHQLIYALKANLRARRAFDELKTLAKKYDVDHWLCGCTELHIVSSHMIKLRSQPREVFFIDPLLTIAASIHDFESL